jgi:hypothetical protein
MDSGNVTKPLQLIKRSVCKFQQLEIASGSLVHLRLEIFRYPRYLNFNTNNGNGASTEEYCRIALRTWQFFLTGLVNEGLPPEI